MACSKFPRRLSALLPANQQKQFVNLSNLQIFYLLNAKWLAKNSLYFITSAIVASNGALQFVPILVVMPH